jgi:hypothetical protein
LREREGGRSAYCSQVRVREQVVAGLALPELVALLRPLPRGGRSKKGARGGEREEATHLRVNRGRAGARWEVGTGKGISRGVRLG